MRTIFERHLQTQIVVNLFRADKLDAVKVVFVDDTTVSLDAGRGSYVHIPFSRITSAAEHAQPRIMKTSNGKVETSLVVELVHFGESSGGWFVGAVW